MLTYEERQEELQRSIVMAQCMNASHAMTTVHQSCLKAHSEETTDSTSRLVCLLWHSVRWGDGLNPQNSETLS